MADYTISAIKDVETGNVAIVGVDIGSGVIAFGIGVEL
jgi:hypothetical protein